MNIAILKVNLKMNESMFHYPALLLLITCVHN